MTFCRTIKFESFEGFLIKTNKELKNATHSRDYDKTRQAIINELKRLKIKKYFHDPVLTEITIERKNKRGKKTSVKSFQVTADKKLATITDREKLDGLCVFISNHVQFSGKQFIFSGKDIIKAYRDKTKIEDVFKHIKSFLKIRPFYVNLDEHVRAVYSICVLAYFLNKDLADSRKKIDCIDYLNSKNLYEPFRNGDCVTVKDKASGSKMRRTVELTAKQKCLLGELKIKVETL